MAPVDDGALARVELEQSGDDVTVALGGEIDISNHEHVKSELMRCLASSPKRLVLDVSGLAFMDSSGIAVLLQVATHVERVELRNASPLVRRIVETTGIADVLNLAP